MPSSQSVFVHIHPNILAYPGIQNFALEFKKYKELAFDYAKGTQWGPSDFIPTLSEEDQREAPPDHELFGRDRLFTSGWDGYRRWNGSFDRASNDALYHVHIYDPSDDKCIWQSATVEVNQWECTSDAALVYSYIDDLTGNFNFLILEIIAPGAHAKYEEKGAIVYWRKAAEKFWIDHGYLK